MSEVFRYLHGDTNPIAVAVNSATVIELGDLLYLVTDDARPFSDQADLGTLAQNQEGVHDMFLGVALSRSRAGDTLDVNIATRGVFEFDTASATYQPGDLVGSAGTGSGGLVGMANQTVAAVATANLAVGRVSKLATSATKVQVSILSTVMHGGPQTMM